MEQERRNYSKRKLSPLQKWKIEYNFISDQIRATKNSVRGGHVWGQFKTPRQQSFLAMMRQTATEMMHLRVVVRNEAQRLYDNEQAAR